MHVLFLQAPNRETASVASDNKQADLFHRLIKEPALAISSRCKKDLERIKLS